MGCCLLPEGPTGAHGLRNNTDETVRVLMYSTVSPTAVSTVSPTAVSVYPDSDKVGIWVENAEDKLILPRSSATDYFIGEA